MELGINELDKHALVDDIEEVFKETSQMATVINSVFRAGLGGNIVTYYQKFKLNFEYLFMLSSDHPHFADNQIVTKIMKWRDKTLTGSEDIHIGLKLFNEYKTELFASKLLGWK